MQTPSIGQMVWSNRNLCLLYPAMSRQENRLLRELVAIQNQKMAETNKQGAIGYYMCPNFGHPTLTLSEIFSKLTVNSKLLYCAG